MPAVARLSKVVPPCAGVRAFKAPASKRPRTARSAASVPLSAAQQTPDQAAKATPPQQQAAAAPAHSLPFLTVKLPGSRAEPQQQLSPALPLEYGGTPGSAGPLTAQGSSTVPSLPVRPASVMHAAAYDLRVLQTVRL